MPISVMSVFESTKFPNWCFTFYWSSVLSWQRHTKLPMFCLRCWRLLIWHSLLRLTGRYCNFLVLSLLSNFPLNIYLFNLLCNVAMKYNVSRFWKLKIRSQKRHSCMSPITSYLSILIVQIKRLWDILRLVLLLFHCGHSYIYFYMLSVVM